MKEASNSWLSDSKTQSLSLRPHFLKDEENIVIGKLAVYPSFHMRNEWTDWYDQKEEAPHALSDQKLKPKKRLNSYWSTNTSYQLLLETSCPFILPSKQKNRTKI